MRVVIEVPRARGQLRVVRRFVDAWTDAVSVPAGDMPLVVTELVSNAFNASPDDTSVILRLECEEGELRVVVVDEGPGFALGDVQLPSRDAIRGRGLALVAGAVDELRVERVDGLTVVTATRYLG
jgi:anti-sigma regulatory factor (Ser/Thr protein kinase)